MYSKAKKLGRGRLVLWHVLALFLVFGCGDDDKATGSGDGRISVGDLPEGSGNFIGFSDQAEKRTVCGECHVGIQAAWEKSNHAHAWAGLQESGHAQSFCEGCHAVSEFGNPSEESVAWSATGDERFVDVQCESCHGPGLEHIENPDASMPLARISAGLDLEFGCGECHQGTHHPFVEQWENSAHGQVPAQPIALAVSPSCLKCHEGKAALESTFGERTDFALEDEGQDQPILCITCHDPHGSPYEAQLRAPIDVASTEHLCVECHNRRGTPNLQGSNDHGPHAFQGNLGLGETVGWIPDNFQFDAQRLASSHGSIANPGLCATCHVSKFEITNAETGDFVFNATGHSFEATPCVDGMGIPTEGPCDDSERTYQSCASTGCHATADVARNLTRNTTNRINRLLDQLWEDSNGNAV